MKNVFTTRQHYLAHCMRFSLRCPLRTRS